MASPFTLYVSAPFARFQHLVSGRTRPCFDFMPPSAAYGFVLNLASVEMRERGSKAITLIKKGLPRVRLALAALEFPSKQRVYQHLHTYPQDAVSRKEQEGVCFGAPGKITPCWRELLVNFRAYISVWPEKGCEWLEERVRDGLAGKLDRYGVPFLGDSNFMVDEIRIVDELDPAYWFVGVDGSNGYSARLTVTVNRKDTARSVMGLFQPTPKPVVEIPKEAWVSVGY